MVNTNNSSSNEAVTLLVHGIVVTMDAERHLFRDGAVAFSDSTIIAVGESERLLSQYPDAAVIDVRNHIIIPGLVNAHTHVPMSLLRGLVDDQRLDVWLLGYMMPVEREFVGPDFVRWGTLLSAIEMIEGGTTTFCDMYYYEDEVAKATAEAGLRAICGQTILKFPSPDATSYDESLEYTRGFIERWKDHELIVPAVAPHAPYTATEDMLKKCIM